MISIIEIFAPIFFLSILVYFPVCFVFQVRLVKFIILQHPEIHAELDLIGRYWSTRLEQASFRRYLRDKVYELILDEELTRRCNFLRQLYAFSGSIMLISFIIMFGGLALHELLF